MRAMFKAEVEPRLQRLVGSETPTRHIIRVLGIPESVLEQRLEGLTVPGLEIGFRAGVPSHEVKLRFSSQFPEAQRRELVHDAMRRLGNRAFGVDCGDLAEVVGKKLTARGETVATAESCTAGRLSAWIASIPGASAYLSEGAVVYSNAAKIRYCGVDPELFETDGAVSEAVARALSTGIRVRAGTTWGIGITGLAGPGGERPGKPVGTVHISVAGPDHTWHRRYQFQGDRDRVTRRSTGEALYRLYRELSS
jgi:nicotinamide-nucleotide amidase